MTPEEQRRRKQELINELANQQRMQQYNSNKKKYNISQLPSDANNISKGVYNIGKGISSLGDKLSSNANTNISNFGNKMNTFGGKVETLSGRPALNSFADKTSNMLNAKLGLNAPTTNTGAISSAITQEAPMATGSGSIANGTANASLQSGADNAGKAAGGALGKGLGVGGSVISAGLDAKDMIQNGVNFNNASDMALDIGSGVAAATGVGAPVAIAIQAAKFLKNLLTGAKEKEMAKVQEAAQQNANKNIQANNEMKQDVMNKNQEIINANNAKLQNAQQTSPFEGFLNNALQKGREIMPGVSQQELDNFKASINPADYTTQLNDQETQGYNNWVQQNNIPISNDYDMQGYYQKYVSPFEGLASQGYTPEQIAGARQGLNGGDKNLDQFIKDNNINIPQGDEEIALAREGKLNYTGYDPETQHFTDEFKMPNHETFSNESKYYNKDNEKYAGIWDNDQFIKPITTFGQDVQLGVDDFKNGFYGGLGTDVDGLWGNIGKGANVANNILSNPLLQGTIAGAIYGKDKGDALYGLGKGVEWAQNKAKSNYYARMLGQQPGLFGNFDNKDYEANTNAQYRKGMLDVSDKKYQMYAQNVLSQIDMRDKDFNRKVNEFAAKHDLDKKKLQATIDHYKATEGIAKERNDIARIRANNIGKGSDINTWIAKENYKNAMNEYGDLKNDITNWSSKDERLRKPVAPGIYAEGSKLLNQYYTPEEYLQLKLLAAQNSARALATGEPQAVYEDDNYLMEQID